MPKYFFQIRRVNEASSHESFDAEYDDDKAAREAAAQSMKDMAQEAFSQQGFAEFEISVRDHGGHEIARRWARFVAEDFT